MRPTIQRYNATDVINWRIARVGAKTMLALVVLQEEEETQDEFAITSEARYRVLRLLPEGVMVEVWHAARDAADKRQVDPQARLSPEAGQRARWGEIPFTFVGAQNNDTTSTTRPLTTSRLEHRALPQLGRLRGLSVLLRPAAVLDQRSRR